MALFFTACLNIWKREQWSLSSVRTCLFPISAAWCRGRGADGEMAGRQDRQVSVSPQPGPFPQGWATSSSALCRADTWHRATRYLGSSLSWVMRLGLLGAFNYQPNVQKHFSLETFTQAKPLFTKKASCFLFLAKKTWLQGEISLWRNLSCSNHDPPTFLLPYPTTHLAECLTVSAGWLSPCFPLILSVSWTEWLYLEPVSLGWIDPSINSSLLNPSRLLTVTES